MIWKHSKLSFAAPMVTCAVVVGTSVSGQPPVPPGQIYPQPLVLATAKEGIERIESVQLMADGTALLVFGEARATNRRIVDVATVWELPAARLRRRMETRVARLSADGRLLAGWDDKSIRIWDVATGVAGHRFGSLAEPIFSPDGRYLITHNHGDDDDANANAIQVWEVQSGKRVFHAPRPKDIFIGYPAFLNRNRLGFVTTYHASENECRLHLADLATGAQRESLRFDSDHSFSQRNAGAGDTWAAIDPDGRPRLYDAVTGKLIRRFGPPGSTKTWWWDVDVSTDGRWLVGPIRQGVLAVWDVSTGAERATIEFGGQFLWVPTARFSPDGRYVVILWESGVNNTFWTRSTPHVAVYSADGRLVRQDRGVSAVEFDRAMKSVVVVTNTRGEVKQDDPPNTVTIHDAAAWLAGGAKKE